MVLTNFQEREPTKKDLTYVGVNIFQERNTNGR
jgi:hypothetical protein